MVNGKICFFFFFFRRLFLFHTKHSHYFPLGKVSLLFCGVKTVEGGVGVGLGGGGGDGEGARPQRSLRVCSSPGSPSVNMTVIGLPPL